MSKGSTYERDVARDFTEWLTGKRNPPVMWRSRLSGGWKHRGERHVGDLAPDGEEGERFLSVFAVEIKHRKMRDLDFWFAFSRGETAPFWQWWVKHYTESLEAGLCPIMVVKRDYYPPLIAVPMSFAGHCVLPCLTVSGLTFGPEGVKFYQFEEFLNTYEPGFMLEEGRQWTTNTQARLKATGGGS